MIYADYAATTPMSENALKVYGEVASKYYGNPSSLHDVGASANQILEKCREELARSIGGETRGIYFTSGGSDSNALAIQSIVKANNHKGRHIITTEIEHASILSLFQALEEDGYDVDYLPVDEFGSVHLDDVKRAIREDTILASIHHANSEIGTIQPVDKIGQILSEHSIPFHCDCVQTFGKIPIDVKAAKIDSISISSHKIYGPKGVGACYICPACSWLPLIPNTSHEGGFRPGTVNVPGIAAFVTAAQDIKESMEMEAKRQKTLRQKFIAGLNEMNIGITVETHPINSLPHIIGMRIHGVEGQYTMLECNRFGVAISTGSACQVGKQEPSKTMTAIGRNKETAKEFVRLSFGKLTTEEEIDEILSVFDRYLKNHFR
jgi:cysteine desulfurase